MPAQRVFERAHGNTEHLGLPLGHGDDVLDTSTRPDPTPSARFVSLGDFGFARSDAHPERLGLRERILEALPTRLRVAGPRTP